MSRGTSKTDFAKELEAHELLDTTNGEAMAAAAGTIDLLIFTASGGFADVNQYLTLMKPYGNMYIISLLFTFCYSCDYHEIIYTYLAPLL